MAGSEAERHRWLLHEAVLPHLRDRDGWRDVARNNLNRISSSGLHRSHAHTAVEQWRTALDSLSQEEIEQFILTPGEDGDLLRVLSPLAGLLPESERLRIIRTSRRKVTAEQAQSVYRDSPLSENSWAEEIEQARNENQVRDVFQEEE